MGLLLQGEGHQEGGDKRQVEPVLRASTLLPGRVEKEPG